MGRGQQKERTLACVLDTLGRLVEDTACECYRYDPAPDDNSLDNMCAHCAGKEVVDMYNKEETDNGAKT